MSRRASLRLAAACFGLGAVLVTCALVFSAEPCVYKVQKHERHTTTAQKRTVFQRASVPYDKAHRPLYVVDHIVPLELGGVDEVDNMQLQTKEEGHAKDRVENQLAACVCRGETPLAVAQAAVRNWLTVHPGECPKEAP